MAKSKWKQQLKRRAFTTSPSVGSSSTDTKHSHCTNKRQKSSNLTGDAECEVEMATLIFDDAFSAGLAFEQLSSYDGAVEAFKRAVECQPDHLGALTHLADDYYLAGDLDKALIYYTKASKLTDGQEDASISFRLGLTYSALKQLPKATEAYQMSMRINARALDAANNADEGSEQIEKAYGITLAALAEAYGELGDLDAAVKVFEDAADRFPNSANVHYNLATMRMARSKSTEDNAFDAEVVRMLERAIELDPKTRDFIVDLVAYLEQHQQQLDRLCQLKRKAEELESADATVGNNGDRDGEDHEEIASSEGDENSEDEEDSEDGE
uniref:Uncharacterized protein n=1 Tax=Peronospora matthiolae TaxID=2874970 RepID=A0AAV1TZG5_9STRA